MSVLELMTDYSTDRNYILFEEDEGKKEIIRIFKGLFEKTKGVKNSKMLEDADIIVAFGRGYHPEKGIEDIKDIARKLGAQYAATRPVQDMNIISFDRVLGKTALSANPKIYIGFGVSGAVQHLGSVKAQEIIAVNNNKNSAIFRHAKYAILGDAREVAKFINGI
jgi:hypothetical protein